ncbi:MAG: hypothetical protein ACK515_19385 [bacterium]|jgi:hypothetical protein|nr:hypothetical protein [Betaproteobacteria bacterium]
METSTERSRFRRYLRYGISVVAIAVGLKYGFDFGNQISGPLMGVVGAINGAVFCALILDYLIERIFLAGDRRRESR